MKEEKYPYQRLLKDKILQAIEKIATEDLKFTNDFNFGQKFMKEQIVKKINEAEI